MRVALVLTGHMRCWEHVFPNTKQKILDRWNPDVYIHTWADVAYWAPHSVAGITTNNGPLDVNGVMQAYNPVSMTVERIDTVMPTIEKMAAEYSNHYHVPKNILSMFRKMHLGVQETHQLYREYDLVIRMRPDLEFKTELPELDPECFYTIHSRNHMGRGTSDIFQAASHESMTRFSEAFNPFPSSRTQLWKLYIEHGLLCPHELSEKFLLEQETTTGVKWIDLMIPFHLMHTPLGMYVHESKYR